MSDWRLKQIQPVQASPVDLADVKEHLRVETADEDSLIQSYVDAAVAYLEGPYGGGFVLGSQVWEYYTDHFPAQFHLPLYPVQSVDEIRYVDDAGQEQTLATTKYRIDTVSNPARIRPGYDVTWPITRALEPNAVAVQFTAGFDPLPADLRQLVLFMVAHYYEMRSPVISGMVSSSVEFTIESILSKYRVPGIG